VSEKRKTDDMNDNTTMISSEVIDLSVQELINEADEVVSSTLSMTKAITALADLGYCMSVGLIKAVTSWWMGIREKEAYNTAHICVQ
jgi:hypothetical protein